MTALLSAYLKGLNMIIEHIQEHDGYCYFCKVVKELVPDKREIKEALKCDYEIEGANLVTKFNLQIK